MADDVLKGALERFEESQDATDFNRSDAEADMKFARLADQWPDKIKEQRQAEGRPCLTINKLPSFIRQVVNDSRQNKPGINVKPVDNGADEDTAEVISGIIRSIERASNADVAYDTAIDHAASGGFGFFRLGIEYAHDDTFNMVCKIKRVPNPLMVHWDVNSTEFDASDWEYAFVSDFLTKEQFKNQYPKAEPVSFEGSGRDDVATWLDDDKIRVAEYWQRESEQKDLLLLSDGRMVREDHLANEARRAFEALTGEKLAEGDKSLVRDYMDLTGLQEQRRRKVDVLKVTRRIISGVEVIEEDPWPGSLIPICPVWGEEVIADGRRHFRSMIRDAKDPQTMFNFWRSATSELVALAPRAPWVGPKGFVPKGQEQKWATANARSHAYLEYDPSAGPGPERQAFAGVPAGALQEALNASDDMKAIIGIYDSSLGARSNETSGRAILARQKEADVSNFHFIDNLHRAIRYAAKCLVEVIPSVYSAQQTIRILGEDMKEKVVRLTQEAGGALPKADGTERLYNLSVGKYDVDIDSGPSYATAREESRETLIQIMREIPGAATVIGDLAMAQFDFKGADEVAERLKAMGQAQGIIPPDAQPGGMPGMPPPMPGAPPGAPPQPGAPMAQPAPPGPPQGGRVF